MLPQSFFDKPALDLAKSLLGCTLVHKTKEGITSGVIVETECYHQDDEASHTFRGPTARNKVMFGPGGHAYIYFTYGMHYCFNVVAGQDGKGEGVLIRALEPLEGMEIMKKRRGKDNIHQLCSGPAKLVQAMGISKADYGTPLFAGNLHIKSPDKAKAIQVATGPRIGIKQAVDKPWRFWVKGNPFVSK